MVAMIMRIKSDNPRENYESPGIEKVYELEDHYPIPRVNEVVMLSETETRAGFHGSVFEVVHDLKLRIAYIHVQVSTAIYRIVREELLKKDWRTTDRLQ